MAATEAAKQAIWLQELLGEVVWKTCEKVKIMVDNKSAIALTKNPVFTAEANIYTKGSILYANVLRKSKLRGNMYQEVSSEQTYWPSHWEEPSLSRWGIWSGSRTWMKANSSLRVRLLDKLDLQVSLSYWVMII